MNCQDDLDACGRELSEIQSGVEEKVKQARVEAGRIAGDVGTFYALKSRVEMMEEFEEGKQGTWDLKAEKATMETLFLKGIQARSFSTWPVSERTLWTKALARMRPTLATPSHSRPSLLLSQPIPKVMLLPLTPDLFFLCNLTCDPTCVWVGYYVVLATRPPSRVVEYF